jgi:hypothetical protein
MISHHVVASVSLAGSAFDFFGGLYLAYDLLGGQHGPLRTLTRGLTYSLLCGLGFALALGLRFAVPAGLAVGFTVAIEFARASRQQPSPGLAWDTFFSFIRGVGFGIGLYPTFGWLFAVSFVVLITLGQTFAYSRGITPTMDYEIARRLRITRKQLLSALNRTLGYALTALLCSLISRHADHSLAFAVLFGLTIGVVTAMLNFFGPSIEWLADSQPARRLGVIGVCLILIGFSLQSFQYWVNLLDIPVD